MATRLAAVCGFVVRVLRNGKLLVGFCNEHFLHDINLTGGSVFERNEWDEMLTVVLPIGASS